MASLMNPVFEVMPIDPSFDPSKVPSTGEEYLQLVMYERQKCPEIVTVPIDEKKLKRQVLAPIIAIEEKVQCRSELLPTTEWQLYQIAHFQKMRNKVERISSRRERMGNPIPIPSLAMEQLFEKAVQNKEVCKTLFCSRTPLLDIVYYIGQQTWLELFDIMVELFKDLFKIAQSSSNDKPVAITQNQMSLEFEDPDTSYDWLCLWLYAGLVNLKQPLEPAMHDVLRQITRACAKLRAIQSEDKTFLDTVQLTIPICIISKYFNQQDLAD